MKKLIVLLLAVLLLTGCGSAESAPDTTAAPETTAVTTTVSTEPVQKPREETRIFISLPDETSSYWSAAGEDLKMLLENLTYQVTLSYADADPFRQEEKLIDALEAGTDCLIVAPVDAFSLSVVGDAAKEKGVPLIAYDRMLMNTDGVSYYVSYDYQAMGLALGQFIEAQKGLANLEAGSSVTMELFMGSPEDSSAWQLYQGIMLVLQPYLEAGTLVVSSGRTAFEDTCMVAWDTENVKAALEQHLKNDYRKDAPQVICTVSDDFAQVCSQVLAEKRPGEAPLITGVGGDQTLVEEGTLGITFSMDMQTLNEQCMTLVDDLLTGKMPQVNNPEGCDNQAMLVPAQLCDFTQITQESLQPEETVPEDTTPDTVAATETENS